MKNQDSALIFYPDLASMHPSIGAVNIQHANEYSAKSGIVYQKRNTSKSAAKKTAA